jgi:hypothetical protein
MDLEMAETAAAVELTVPATVAVVVEEVAA